MYVYTTDKDEITEKVPFFEQERGPKHPVFHMFKPLNSLFETLMN